MAKNKKWLVLIGLLGLAGAIAFLVGKKKSKKLYFVRYLINGVEGNQAKVGDTLSLEYGFDSSVTNVAKVSFEAFKDGVLIAKADFTKTSDITPPQKAEQTDVGHSYTFKLEFKDNNGVILATDEATIKII